MKHSLKLPLAFVIVFLLFSMIFPVFAHSGDTDANGGHTDHSTGQYHYHHGYSAHSHYDIDYDGGIDCPYDFISPMVILLIAAIISLSIYFLPYLFWTPDRSNPQNAASVVLSCLCTIIVFALLFAILYAVKGTTSWIPLTPLKALKLFITSLGLSFPLTSLTWFASFALVYLFSKLAEGYNLKAYYRLSFILTFLFCLLAQITK